MSFVRAVELVRERAGDPATYPWSLPVVRGLERLDLDPAVTVVVGENGTGKSTLIEALAVALGLNPEGGTQNFTFSTRASHSPLHEALRPCARRDGHARRSSCAQRAQGLLALMRRMADLVAERAQFVIATHSPILMAYPDATIYECTDAGLVPVAFEDIDHVRLTRAFLDDPQRFLHHLLDD